MFFIMEHTVLWAIDQFTSFVEYILIWKVCFLLRYFMFKIGSLFLMAGFSLKQTV